MSLNVVSSNWIFENTGLGVYMQLGRSPANRGNATRGNRLYRNCVQGAQDSSLVFGGIGWSSGFDCVSEGDILIDSGGVHNATVAPGFHVGSQPSSGRAIGVTVDGASLHGFSVQGSHWTLLGCAAQASGQYATGAVAHGFAIDAKPDQVVTDVHLVNCTARGNLTGSGVRADGTASGGSVEVAVTGGAFFDNLDSGVSLAGTDRSQVTGTTLHNNRVAGLTLSERALHTLIGPNTIHNEAVGISIAPTVANTVLLPQSFSANGINVTNDGGPYIASGSIGLGDAVWVGSGAPDFAATAGDQYRRTDEPETRKPRWYINARSGNHWTPIA